MTSNKIQSFKLEKHETKDTKNGQVNGSLTVIWRNWDKIINLEPKMIYVSSIDPGEIKGPHLHTKRDSYFVCIHGKVVFIIKDPSGKYLEIESSEKEPNMICVPKNFPSSHINLVDHRSTVLVLANLAWRPNDNEMLNVDFSDYDWKKWSKYLKNQ